MGLSNGYTLKYNEFWGTWQLSHSESGYFGEFKSMWDAIEFVSRG